MIRSLRFLPFLAAGFMAACAQDADKSNPAGPSAGAGAAGAPTPSPTPVPTPGATARYVVQFDSAWSRSTHPQDFPSNPHFSGLIGATHDARVRFWTPGQTASEGIRLMAERGSKSPLSDEIQSAINAGTARFLLSGGGIADSPGGVSLEFTISREHPLVSLVSMLAPSPDWFVACATSASSMRPAACGSTRSRCPCTPGTRERTAVRATHRPTPKPARGA